MFKEFDANCLEDSKEKLEKILEQSRAEVNKLLEIENKTFENFMKPYQEIGERINDFLTPIFHLDSVKNSELTKKIQQELIPIISVYETDMSQNEQLFSSIKDIHYNFKSTNSNIQNKILENEIRDFKLGGCGLDDDKKNRLKEINISLSEASNNFSQNLIEATNAYELIIDNNDDVKGIPASDLELAKEEIDGKTIYKFTLQMPSYIAYMTYGQNRDIREQLYKAYCTRAPQNEELIEKILTLKKEKANILGFANYAELSLATKMANSPKEVIEFLEELANKSKNGATKELQELKDFAKEFDGTTELYSYDVAYYSEKLKEKSYDIDEEYYRPYFEKESVLKGFFEFLHKLFGIEFVKTDTKTWDEKVNVYNILENKKVIARIYIDLEARKDKRGGAWMNNWHTRHIKIDGELELPTAFIVCNFPPSTNTQKSLLRHSDIVTLFHEMGHALHHLLSKMEEPFVSGINGVAWDVVEFPSQFLEYFSYQKDVLKIFAKHYETKEVLDDGAIDKLMKARNFQSALSTLRQVEFAMFDFKLYMSDKTKPNEVQELIDSVRDEVAVIKPPKYNKFQNGFSHIFSGGYSAGYYSYKWAEVLSADAFYLFLDSTIFNNEIATKYKELILGSGGAIDMNELFYKLANREPKVDSLLKIDGIIS